MKDIEKEVLLNNLKALKKKIHVYNISKKFKDMDMMEAFWYINEAIISINKNDK